MTVYTGYAEAPAACGELIQGQLNPGEDFLLSLPVDLWSKAEVHLTPSCACITCHPGHKTKSVKAVRSLLNHLGLNEWGAHIRIRSNIPEGKGMASSTADIRAVCEAAANALGIELNPHLLSSLAIHIEPSDSTLYAKPVIYNHRQGEALFELNPIPPMDVLLIDTGGTVDTLDYNHEHKHFKKNEFAQYHESLNMLSEGIKCKDPVLIGKAATQSAFLNQRFLHKPELPVLNELVKEFHVYGLCVAHSGTVIGLLLNEDRHPVQRIKNAIIERLNTQPVMITAHTI